MTMIHSARQEAIESAYDCPILSIALTSLLLKYYGIVNLYLINLPFLMKTYPPFINITCLTSLFDINLGQERNAFFLGDIVNQHS